MHLRTAITELNHSSLARPPPVHSKLKVYHKLSPFSRIKAARANPQNPADTHTILGTKIKKGRKAPPCGHSSRNFRLLGANEPASSKC